jgi:hypothetical protein
MRLISQTGLFLAATAAASCSKHRSGLSYLFHTESTEDAESNEKDGIRTEQNPTLPPSSLYY